MKFYRPKGQEVGFQIAPMTDIVFQLLIFFLLASTMKAAQEYVKNMPKSTECREIEEKKQEEVVINVTREGKIVVAKTGYTAESLQSYLESKDNISTVRVYIRGDKTASWEEVRKIIRACAAAGVSNMFFGTYNAKQ